MYRTAKGEEIFVIDGHTHFWDGSPANQKNIHGKQFIDCFYAYHSNLSPPSEKWEKEKFEKYDAKTMFDDLFVTGYDDMAILQPTYLTDFYKNGFNTTERNSAMKKSHPDRFILNGAFDPRDGTKGLEDLHALSEKHKLKGVKLYTAEWRGESKGYKLTDKASYKYLEAAQKLGIKNIHVHKGPTIIPLNRDAFDVADIDDVATSFQDLNFIVEHCGLPRLDDFCWIATQETNVYAGLAVALPFIHTRPGYFAHVISELLFWVGPDKILYGSDYGIWTPKWLIDKFMAFEIPADVTKETGSVLSMETKTKILGLNAARLYGIDVEAQKKKIRTGRRLCPLARSRPRAKVIAMNGDAEESDGPRNRPTHDSRQAEVWACLQGVTDPELDESVTDLNFVTKADVDSKNRVHIEFRLPTYWCAANFSFLMADDMRRAVGALDWVEGVGVVLGEHMYADKINAGLAEGLSFQATFGAEADGSLDELRQTFLVKAFQRRQVALLNHLIAMGHSSATIVSLTLTELGRLPVDDDGEKLFLRYLERRAVVGSARCRCAGLCRCKGSAR